MTTRMTKTKQQQDLGLKIKEMDRPKEFIKTADGTFFISKIDGTPRTNQLPICTGCWYNEGSRKYMRSSPCNPAEPKWCGGYLGILIRIGK